MSSNGLSSAQQTWIDCALAIADIEDREDDGRGHLTSHYVFIRKVLGEPRQDAMQMAVAFRHVRLDQAKCERVAVGWDES